MDKFWNDWFGPHAGREVFYADRKTREFIDKPEQLEAYVKECREKRIPSFCSVQPYKARDQLFGLEKLFFEFDCEEDVSKAWKDAKSFAENLIKYYGVSPLIKFSGRKGYHVDVFLNQTVEFPIWRLEFVKAVYERTQRKILKGLKLETLDPNVIGDIKRLERVPYSTHEKSGELCRPVDLEGKPLTIVSLEPYREHGLETRLLETICREIKEEEKWREIRSCNKRSFKTDSNVRPCIEAALKQKLETGNGHKMRLAIATEYLNHGFSIPEVVNLFSYQGDFGDGSKTEYYVKDIVAKNYRPLKCSTIKELGFCLGTQCRRKRSS